MYQSTRNLSTFWATGGQLTLLDLWAANDATISSELLLMLDVDIEALDLDTWAEQPEHVHRMLCAQLGIDAPADDAVLASSAALKAQKMREYWHYRRKSAA